LFFVSDYFYLRWIGWHDNRIVHVACMAANKLVTTTISYQDQKWKTLPLDLVDQKLPLLPSSTHLAKGLYWHQTTSNLAPTQSKDPKLTPAFNSLQGAYIPGFPQDLADCLTQMQERYAFIWSVKLILILEVIIFLEIVLHLANLPYAS